MNADELKQYWKTVRKFREEHCTKCGVFNKCKGDLATICTDFKKFYKRLEE